MRKVTRFGGFGPSIFSHCARILDRCGGAEHPLLLVGATFLAAVVFGMF